MRTSGGTNKQALGRRAGLLGRACKSLHVAAAALPGSGHCVAVARPLLEGMCARPAQTHCSYPPPLPPALHRSGRAQECEVLLPAVATLLRASPGEYRLLRDHLQRGAASWLPALPSLMGGAS